MRFKLFQGISGRGKGFRGFKGILWDFSGKLQKDFRGVSGHFSKAFQRSFIEFYMLLGVSEAFQGILRRFKAFHGVFEEVHIF